MTSAPARNLQWLETLLDRLPTPLTLVEPGTARVLFANRAAHELAGGALPLGVPASEYHTAYRCFDAEGRRIPDERLPSVRAARGERVADFPLDWETPAGRRSVLVTGETITAPDGAPITVVTFQDVTTVSEAERRERRAREELAAILEGVADSVTAQDAQGRLVYANAAAVRMLGYASAEDLLAATPAEVVGRYEMLTEDRRPFPVEELPGRQALQGIVPEPRVIRFRPADGGPERWSRVKAQPVLDEHGAVRLAINVIEDITELKHSEYTQRFLAEASRVLAGSLDYERTLATVAQLAVPEIADWCAVELAADGRLTRVSVAHVDPEKLAFADELARRYPPDPDAPTGTYNVLRTGRPELYPEIADELLVAAARDPEHLELLRSVGMVSVMIVPMRSRDQVLGAITFVSAESGRRFDTEDLEFAEALALRAGAAVENARLYSQRSAIARTLQASLLPPELPEIERLEGGAMFEAAGEGHDVGGDFYDLFSTADGQWFAVIGDVCGKGVEAAATTALVRYTVRAAAVRRRSPAGILGWLNEAMLRHDSRTERFCTLAVVRLDLADDRVDVSAASGGHPLPRIVRGGGGVDVVGAAGTLIGVTPDLRVGDGTARLDRGDTLVLFTDGLTEARAPEQVWSPQELDAALASAYAQDPSRPVQAMVDAIGAAALGAHGGDPRDDIAILALRPR